MINYKIKDKDITLILCILLGYLGIHHFYNNQVGKGLLYLFTGGLFGIGWIIDIIQIINYKENNYNLKNKAEDNLIYCVNCGKRQNKSNNFCVNCGFTLNNLISKEKYNNNDNIVEKTAATKEKHNMFKLNITNSVIEGNYINNYVIMDFETTGFNAKTDRITEFTLLKYRNDKLIDELTHLVNPDRNIPQSVSNKTGITNELVKNEKRIQDYINDIYNFIDDYVIVGHNINFDLDFLSKELIKNNVLTDDKTYQFVDTLELSKIMIPNLKNYQLETLKEYLKINIASHRSKNDCEVTNVLYQYILEKIKNNNSNIISKRDDSFDNDDFLLELKGKTFCLTGDFKNGTKEEIRSLLTSLGATEKNGVSKNCDYLFVGEYGSDSWKSEYAGTKIIRARELQEKGHHIKIINEEDLFEKLNN